MLIVDSAFEIVAQDLDPAAEPFEGNGVGGILMPQPLDELYGERELDMLQ